MYKLEVPDTWKDDIINHLIEQGLLDEIRFAKAYSLGKMRYNKWGKQKIYAGLRTKSVDNSIINEVLQCIDEDEYMSILRELMLLKIDRIGDIRIDKNKKRLLNYALQKGFESSFVWIIIKEIEQKQ